MLLLVVDISCLYLLNISNTSGEQSNKSLYPKTLLLPRAKLDRQNMQLWSKYITEFLPYLFSFSKKNLSTNNFNIYKNLELL